jgi:hypothetical protein
MPAAQPVVPYILPRQQWDDAMTQLACTRDTGHARSVVQCIGPCALGGPPLHRDRSRNHEAAQAVSQWASPQAPQP